MVIILGPTATGKTTFATHLALALNGEIISADSRQVFKGMDLGTGKDLSEYTISGTSIPYHLIDIAEPGVEYSVFNFQRDCYHAYDQIMKNNHTPIVCGGTGLYLESIINAYPMLEVPENESLRAQLYTKTLTELSEQLSKLKKLHNHTDTDELDRVIRAIEIEEFKKSHPEAIEKSRRHLPSTIFGVFFERETIRKRITLRLRQRLDEGMIEEVEQLLNKGISHERLQRYGLEYKYCSLYIRGDISKETLFDELNIAIHQFAKRQTTWFRRMERNGTKIHWVNGELPIADKIHFVQKTTGHSEY